ncbi:GDP-L-fucose synthase [Alphaproteobacteria bacterium]|nr:GDP-L-fucose synthase [Alphaproteobacteria bacterium]
MIDSKKRNVFVAGHAGMLGSAIVRCLTDVDGVEIIVASKSELDLRDQSQVKAFFKANDIDEIYIAAAKVGGIFANSRYPAEFCYDNLIIPINLVDAAFRAGVKKLLFIGSSCIYPKFAQQPIAETELLSGYLEPTNEPYAIAKIAGLKLVESYNRQYGESHQLDYRSVMPTNLYGIGDSYNLENSHVIPGLIRRFHEAKLNGDKEVAIWGSGKVRREFLIADDAASACAHVMDMPSNEYHKVTTQMCSHLNIGNGDDISIAELAGLISHIVSYKGDITYDVSKPDGTPKKLLDSSILEASGWEPSISLREGIEKTYSDFLSKYETIRT